MAKNEKYFSVSVKDMTNLGYGVATLPEGKTVFIKNAVRGDVADIIIIKETASYSVATVDKLVERSKHRIEDTCPYSKMCGGCVFRSIAYEEEKRIKAKHIEDAFRKYASINIKIDDVLTFSEDRYRNNVRYPVGSDKNGKLFAGFYHERSHKIVKIDDCLAQKQCITPILAELMKVMNKYKLTSYNEITGKGLVRHVCIRCNKKDDVSICVVLNGTTVPESIKNTAKKITETNSKITGFYVNFNTENTNVIFGDKTETVISKGVLTEEVCGKTFIVSPRSFFQINSETAEMIYEKAREYMGNNIKTLIDLYCGTGAVGICVSSEKMNLYGCEIIPEAVEDAVKNGKLNGYVNAYFECCDASEGIDRAEDYFGKADAITVDPPRKGLSTDTVKTVGESGIDNLIYISCNPDTIARDVKVLKEYGYFVKKLSAFDMFPRTSHVETVCLLTRDHTNLV